MDKIEAQDLGKRFGRRFIFRDASFSVSAGESVAVVGPNGSGKSTLLRILAGLLTPTEGSVTGLRNEVQLAATELTSYVGFVAPYVNMYDSFTAVENLQFIVRLRSLPRNGQLIESVLNDVGLKNSADQRVAAFSSGMRQRLKLAMAILHQPEVLMLDEPGTNLDAAGRAVVERIVRDHRERGGMVILATNSDVETALCSREISVTDFSPSVTR